MNLDASWKSLLRHGLELNSCIQYLHCSVFFILGCLVFVCYFMAGFVWHQLHEIGKKMVMDNFCHPAGVEW